VSLWSWFLEGAGRGSGPRVARTFHRLLALTFLIAWVSLWVQLDVLIGQRGLLPAAAYLEPLRGRASLLEVPTVFWFTGTSDAALHAGVAVGVVLALLAVLGLWPRACIAACTLLYLGYASVARTFLSFQWDNLLLECGLLAVFLPRNRPARWIHFLFRVLLFKLYFESGIAKWQSFLRDWHDGSAMTFYYETAPLPAWPGWYAHHLPQWWHHFESWAVLGFELLLPLVFFAPRLLRLPVFFALTAFQVANAVTANYGFFCYLSAFLHVFLLDERDLPNAREWFGLLPYPLVQEGRKWKLTLRGVAAVPMTLIYLSVCSIEGIARFAEPGEWFAVFTPLRRAYGQLRLINTYHLFGHITRQRIEPEFQTLSEGEWRPHHMWHKPGDVKRAPNFVAPHQPRVDFQLWFYGLGYQQQTPEYVRTLVDRLCHAPGAVQPLFRSRLPPAPEAVQIVYWRYTFSDPAERRSSGAWWEREEVGRTRTIQCRGKG